MQVTSSLAPALRNITLQPYADGALLVGDGNDGKPAPFYLTEDGGRTWNPNALKRPNDIAATHSSALAGWWRSVLVL